MEDILRLLNLQYHPLTAVTYDAAVHITEWDPPAHECDQAMTFVVDP